jgi:hypothetical protein
MPSKLQPMEDSVGVFCIVVAVVPLRIVACALSLSIYIVFGHTIEKVRHHSHSCPEAVNPPIGIYAVSSLL